MTDLGKAYDAPTPAISDDDKTPKKSYPCLHGMDSARLPGLKDYDVGEEVTLQVTGIIQSKSLRQEGKTETEDITIELRTGAIMPDKLRKTMQETNMSKTNAQKALAT